MNIPHDTQCTLASGRSIENSKQGACARLILRLPDPASFPLTLSGRHTAACFTLDEQHNGKLFFMRKLHCLLHRCNMPAQISNMLHSVADLGRWVVLEYVPGSHLRVMVLVYWNAILETSQETLKLLHKLGTTAADFVTPFKRFNAEVDFLTLRKMLEPCAETPDRNGSELLRIVEESHQLTLGPVTKFIENGDAAEYESASCNIFAKPTVRSLQAAIDASRYVNVQLKPYQIATVAWALDREADGNDLQDVFQLRADDPKYLTYRFVHNYERWSCESVKPSDTKKPRTRGGFILDEMGMGKTLQMLTIIIASDHMEAAEELTKQNVLDRAPLDIGILDPAPALPTPTAPKPESCMFDFKYNGAVSKSQDGGTLIIVPLSLMNQWVFEIETNVVNGPQLLRPLQYHGTGRHGVKLNATPVVITTYETIAADVRHYRTEKALHDAMAKTAWRCSGDRTYLRPIKGQKPLEVNDMIVYLGVQKQVVGFDAALNLVYLHPVYHIPSHALMTMADIESVKQRFAYDASLVSTANLVGTLVRCRSLHEHALPSLQVCPLCWHDCRPELFEFLKTVVKTPLEDVSWQRIVLDESHKIQSSSTMQYDAISRLRASKKWCMTGTPMPKSVANLKGQLDFLGVERCTISVATVRWLADCMIRHTKKNCLRDALGNTTLPPITYRDVYIDLSETDMEAYKACRVATLERYSLRNDTDKMFIPQMFQFLARERKACTVMCESIKLRNVRRTKDAPPPLPPVPENALNPKDDCPVCFEPIPHAVMLPCRHCFCNECLLATLEAGEHKCPLCQVALSGPQVVDAQRTCKAVGEALAFVEVPVHNPEEACAETPDVLPQRVQAIEKFNALLGLVRGEHARPTLVYTQFDDTVYSIQKLLQEQDVPCQVLTGSMTRAGREASIKKFRELPYGVLVLSLRTAAVGLNLIHASLVVFMDAPMNTGLEQQACGRVHRLGQKNSVEIVHFIAKGTVEERIREFRDLDTSDKDGSAIQVGKVTVVLNECQKRLWRQQQLQNLMGKR